jgi:hypothetical protein
MHAHCLVARLKQERGFEEVELEEERRRRIIWPASPIKSSNCIGVLRLLWPLCVCVSE